jgi:hypothetical protein
MMRARNLEIAMMGGRHRPLVDMRKEQEDEDGKMNRKRKSRS